MDKEELKKLPAIAAILLLFAAIAQALPETDRALREFYGIDDDRGVDLTIVEKESEIPEALKWLPDYVAGVASPETGNIAIFKQRTGAYPFGSFEQVYAHELSHVYLYRATGVINPRWFDEGVAMKLAAEWGYKDDIYLSLALPRIAYGKFDLQKIETDFRGGEGAGRISYAVSRAFVKDLFTSNADLREFIRLIKRTGSFEDAFILRFGRTPEQMFRPWAKNLPWWGPLFSMIASAGSFWTLALLLFLLASFVTFRKRRQWKKKWEEEEKRAENPELLQ